MTGQPEKKMPLAVYLYRETGDLSPALPRLPQRRQESAARLLRLGKPDEARACIAAECLLRYAVGADAVPVYAPSGKPYLVNSSVHFSLSHSGGVAVCAVAAAPVGADCERIGAVRGAARALTEAEAAHLRALPERERAAYFYDLWTRKEAVIKLFSSGVAYMQEVRLAQNEALFYGQAAHLSSWTDGGVVFAVAAQTPFALQIRALSTAQLLSWL
ncbi:MAG: 4'-phosphopantetheinyl transferase superfamily protein [Clostridiales bacterium]|jgi:phosphopantetheinyl transferase|nr:4'-phosphopantetheinyl transferase superfamily protein [Clostridiales bacterium]